MTTQIHAKQRLLALDTPDKKSRRDQTQKTIDMNNKKVEQLKHSMPSRNNSTKVSPTQKINTQKQVLNLKMRNQDLHKKKLQLK